tara:strand:+ start:23378 stop:23551 length:174 start_codon:yes stop_codon:yes gene_type:complete
MHQSLYDTMQNLPSSFIKEVIQCTDVSVLQQMMRETTCADRIAVIDARITKINYLVI